MNSFRIRSVKVLYFFSFTSVAVRLIIQEPISETHPVLKKIHIKFIAFLNVSYQNLLNPRTKLIGNYFCSELVFYICSSIIGRNLTSAVPLRVETATVMSTLCRELGTPGANPELYYSFAGEIPFLGDARSARRWEWTPVQFVDYTSVRSSNEIIIQNTL